MKSMGMIRRLDPLGRICLPKELRRVLDINEGDGLEIFTNEETIVLRKYQPGCQLCNGLTDVHTVDGIKICRECAIKIAKAVK